MAQPSLSHGGTEGVFSSSCAWQMHKLVAGSLSPKWPRDQQAGEGCLIDGCTSDQFLPVGAGERHWWGGRRASRTAAWPACRGSPCRHYALAPASEKAAALAWAGEKLRFLEMCISTFITVLSAKCRGGQGARDGSCYL